MKGIKMTVSINTYRQLLENVDKANYDLREIVHQSISLESHRQRRRSKHFIAQLKAFRQHAASIYYAFILGKGWNCHCKINHVARLRLETRPTLLGIANTNATTAQFRILVAQREKRAIIQYQAVEILSFFDKKNIVVIRNDSKTKSRMVSFDPISSQHSVHFSETSLNQDSNLIVNLCSKLYTAQNSGKAIGFVVDKENDKHKHHFTLADPIITSESEMKSLRDLLSCSGRESRNNRFLRGERLRIAVILASSVLQLHGTPWLEAQWTCRDIHLHERDCSEDDREQYDPYLPWMLCKNSFQPPISSIDQKQSSRCEILIALGLVLVELCVGKPLTEMHTPEDNHQSEFMSRLNTAEKMLDVVYREMGASYGDVVRRCLRQPFDVRVISLENEELQQMVFDKIVTPLSNDLENFEGRS